MLGGLRWLHVACSCCAKSQACLISIGSKKVVKISWAGWVWAEAAVVSWGRKKLLCTMLLGWGWTSHGRPPCCNSGTLAGWIPAPVWPNGMVQRGSWHAVVMGLIESLNHNHEALHSMRPNLAQQHGRKKLLGKLWFWGSKKPLCTLLLGWDNRGFQGWLQHRATCSTRATICWKMAYSFPGLCHLHTCNSLSLSSVFLSSHHSVALPQLAHDLHHPSHFQLLAMLPYSLPETFSAFFLTLAFEVTSATGTASITKQRWSHDIALYSHIA